MDESDLQRVVDEIDADDLCLRYIRECETHGRQRSFAEFLRAEVGGDVDFDALAARLLHES